MAIKRDKKEENKGNFGKEPTGHQRLYMKKENQKYGDIPQSGSTTRPPRLHYFASSHQIFTESPILSPPPLLSIHDSSFSIFLTCPVLPFDPSNWIFSLFPSFSLRLGLVYWASLVLA